VTDGPNSAIDIKLDQPDDDLLLSDEEIDKYFTLRDGETLVFLEAGRNVCQTQLNHCKPLLIEQGKQEGRREVVEWIKGNQYQRTQKESLRVWNEDWPKKLKEWGLRE
jgi:hypothetical protein